MDWRGRGCDRGRGHQECCGGVQAVCAEADGGTAQCSALVVGEVCVFANPVAPPRVLPSRDIIRFLRLITLPAAQREEKRLPLSVRQAGALPDAVVRPGK
jgi:hypothetical protein